MLSPTVVDHEPIPMIARQRLAKLLQSPLRRRMGGHVVMENAPGPHFHALTRIHKRVRNVAVVTTKKSRATITLAWLWTRSSANCTSDRVFAQDLRAAGTSPRCGRLASSQFQIQFVGDARSSPQVGFATAILRINCRRSLGHKRGGRPVAFDFQRQKGQDPLRCQRMRVSGLTTTKAPPANRDSRLTVAINHLR